MSLFSLCSLEKYFSACDNQTVETALGVSDRTIFLAVTEHSHAQKNSQQ